MELPVVRELARVGREYNARRDSLKSDAFECLFPPAMAAAMPGTSDQQIRGRVKSQPLAFHTKAHQRRR